MKKLILLIVLAFPIVANSQAVQWAKDGRSYYKTEAGEVARYELPANKRTVLLSKADLTPVGRNQALPVRMFSFSEDQSKLLLFTNTRKVWRLDTRGDYWVLDLKTKVLEQVGTEKPEASLMFAKFSPDATKVAFVSEWNVYVEKLSTHEVKTVTTDGTRKLINGTFDWVYEEEFACRDGFQWSPDSQHLAYWQIDASQIRDFYMINNTDSVYSKIIPVEYPTAGQSPSPAKIGVADVTTGITIWLKIPGDPQQNYLPRMEWNNADEILVQQLNRKQNESKIYSCQPTSGNSKLIYAEIENA